MTTSCELAMLVLKNQYAQSVAPPTYEYTAGEPPDVLHLLSALVPSEWDQMALTSCDTLTFSVTQRDGSPIDQSIFLFDASA